MLQHALAWAARGFRVFPCAPRTKVPRDDNFYAIATNDPEQVKNLWFNPLTNTYGDYNVGVSTDDLVVVDVDVKDGRNGVAGFIELGGDDNTLAVRTPTGGTHFYYIGPASRNRVNIATGVDIRSHHGYVLAPGSHFVDMKKGVNGHYTLINDTVPALVPPGIEAKLAAPRETMARAGVDIEYDDPQAVAEAEDFLRFTARPSIEGMGGNNNGYEVAARVVNDLAITPETAALLMFEHWNERCIPPWDFADIDRFCRNAAQYATGTQGSRRSEVMFGEVTVLPPIQPPTPQQVGIYLGNLPDVLRLPARPWVYKDLTLRREITTIIAEGAGGKSTLALVLAAHAALGMSFGPWELAVPGVPLRVLVHDDENSTDEQGRIMMAICAEYRLDYAKVKANIVLWTKDHPTLMLAHAEGSKVIVNEQMVNAFIDVVQQTQTDVFMLNPLVNLHQCNENDNAQMKSVMNIITRIATETNNAAFVFHHSAKGSAGAGKTAAGNSEIARGAGAIINASRVALTLTTVSDADKEAIGLRTDTRFTRIDDAKSNFFAKNNADRAKLWLRWGGHIIPTGDVIGVPAIHDIQQTVDTLDALLVNTIDAILTETKNAGRISMMDLLKHLKNDDIFGKHSDQANRSRIDRIAFVGKAYTLQDGRPARLCKELVDGAGSYVYIA